jgi:uncharacterized protein (TIGR02246 family)
MPTAECVIAKLKQTRNKSMKSRTFLLIVLILVVLPAAAQTNGNAKDKEAIKNIALNWQDSWNQHDMKAIAALVAEDVDLITVGGTWLKSRREFEEDHAKSHKMMLKESILTTKNTEVKFIKSDVAVAHVEWSIKGVKDNIYVGGGKAKRKVVNNCGSEHHYQRAGDQQMSWHNKSFDRTLGYHSSHEYPCDEG